ncbi:nuclear transport factor 2 family protein [Nibrella saemangeumensis]|uniref:nuclear transport factor 2 family protein n=1 Tax=Nibrella saemangeumensis TaxID=1084526 RepID=UPI0031E8CBE5
MKRFFWLTAFVSSALCCHGQPSARIEAEIRQLEQTVVTAILNADTTTLKQVWVPEFLVNNPRNDISVNRAAVLQTQKAGLINYSTFDRVIEQMQVQGDVVITMGHETFVSRNDIPGAKAGQPYKRRFTNIWMKKKGKWQQIARHASIICQ